MLHRFQPVSWSAVVARKEAAEMPFLALFREAEAAGLLESQRPARPAAKEGRPSRLLELARERLALFVGFRPSPSAV